MLPHMYHTCGGVRTAQSIATTTCSSSQHALAAVIETTAYLFVADQFPTLKYSNVTAAQYTARLHFWLGHIHIESARKPTMSASMGGEIRLQRCKGTDMIFYAPLNSSNAML